MEAVYKLFASRNLAIVKEMRERKSLLKTLKDRVKFKRFTDTLT